MVRSGQVRSSPVSRHFVFSFLFFCVCRVAACRCGGSVRQQRRGAAAMSNLIKLDDASLQKQPEDVFDLLDKLGEG